PGRPPRGAPVPGWQRRGAARAWRCAWSFLLVVFVVLVFFIVLVLEELPRAADLDVAAERLEFEPGAPRAEREVETVFGLSGQLNGEARVELAVERRDGYRDVGLLGDRHPQIAVMRPKAIPPAVLDRAVGGARGGGRVCPGMSPAVSRARAV